MIRIAFNGILLSTIICLNALAASPCLNQVDREFTASDIVSGTVLTVNAKAVGNPREYMDMQYQVEMLVTEVHTGSLMFNDIVKFDFWKALYRARWLWGPMGQRDVPKVGMEITAYLSKSGDGSYGLLEPNGFDCIIAKAPAPCAAQGCGDFGVIDR